MIDKNNYISEHISKTNSVVIIDISQINRNMGNPSVVGFEED